VATQLETGEYVLSREQAQELRAAVDRLCDRGHPPIDLARPISFELWLDLVVVQATLDGDEETVESIVALLEAALAKRRRPN
jgi:hypothetical protein